MKPVFYLLLCLVGYHSFSQTIKRNDVITNDSIYIDLINPFYAPLEINLEAKDSVRSFIKFKAYGLLQKDDTLKHALIIPKNRIADSSKATITDFVSFDGSFGDPNTVHDQDHLYELPFKKGERSKIIQSFGGKFSHNKVSSRYAVDFGLAIGDTITAARSGRVFFVKEDSKEHCRTRQCIDKGNKVYILHDDGTMAHYVHLDFEGALVEVGDWVEANQPIAISGMTGFTTIPHLHFVLFKSGKESIPFRFKEIKKSKPKPGKYYKKSG